MVQLQNAFNELVIQTLKHAYVYITELIPKLMLAILIMLIGWVCAVLLKKIVSKVVRGFGFDAVSEKTGLKSFLEKGGIKRNPSYIIGLAFYWLIIFSTLVMVFNTLGLGVASHLLNQAVLYIPKIIVALILLAIGIYLSQLADTFVTTTAHLAKIPFYHALGKLSHYAIIGLAIMMALEQLGVATAIVTHSFVILFGIIPLICALIFMIGGKDIIASILSRNFIIKKFKAGDKITVDKVSGEIVSIDLINTTIKSGNEEVIIPNAELASKITKRIKKD